MEIKVYSTPTCYKCNELKDFLKEKNIDFEDINVQADQEAAKRMVAETNQMSVPVIEIDGEFIVGFDKSKIEEKISS